MLAKVSLITIPSSSLSLFPRPLSHSSLVLSSHPPTRLEEGRHWVDLEGERQGARGDGTGNRRIVAIGGVLLHLLCANRGQVKQDLCLVTHTQVNQDKCLVTHTHTHTQDKCLVTHTHTHTQVNQDKCLVTLSHTHTQVNQDKCLVTLSHTHTQVNQDKCRVTHTYVIIYDLCESRHLRVCVRESD